MDIIDIAGVMKHLPHRYPFLMVDRVLDCRPGESLTAIKNVSINEPYFQGHFPNLPVMPGVMILEALAQATGILGFRTRGKHPDSKALYLFVGIDKARFKRQVEPGDQLQLYVRLLRQKRNIWAFDSEARVGEEIAAQARLMCAEQEILP